MHFFISTQRYARGYQRSCPWEKNHTNAKKSCKIALFSLKSVTETTKSCYIAYVHNIRNDNVPLTWMFRGVLHWALEILIGNYCEQHHFHLDKLSASSWGHSHSEVESRLDLPCVEGGYNKESYMSIFILNSNKKMFMLILPELLEHKSWAVVWKKEHHKSI